jgi:hypothetical protein
MPFSDCAAASIQMKEKVSPPQSELPPQQQVSQGQGENSAFEAVQNGFFVPLKAQNGRIPALFEANGLYPLPAY